MMKSHLFSARISQFLLILSAILLDPVSMHRHPFSAIRTIANNNNSLFYSMQDNFAPFDEQRMMKDGLFPGYLNIRGGTSEHLPSSLLSKAATREELCWAFLLGAILLDTVSTTLMKKAQDEKSLSKLCLAYSGYFLGLSGFGLSLSSIDVGIAYAVWAALGTALVSIIGIIVFDEPCSVLKLCCLAMVILGVIGLNLMEVH